MSDSTEDIHIRRGGMIRLSDDDGCVTLAVHGGRATLSLSADEAGHIASNLMTISERVVASAQRRVKELEAQGRELVARIAELEKALRDIIDAADECDAPHWSVRAAISEGREVLEKARET